MKYLRPATHIIFAFVVLTGIGCDNEPPNLDGERVPLETTDTMDPRPLEQILDDTSKDAKPGDVVPELPPGGIIPGKTGPPEQVCGVECSCATVQLVRVTTMDIKQEGGWFSDWEWHSPVTHYQLGDAATPPETGPLVFPDRDLHDRVCFFFSYPECAAYWRWNGDNTGCTVLAEFRWPVRNSVSGERTHTWQLYGVQGWNMGTDGLGDFRNGTPNVVCLNVHFDGFQIPAGRGEVKWSVESRICEPSIEFEVVSP